MFLLIYWWNKVFKTQLCGCHSFSLPCVGVKIILLTGRGERRAHKWPSRRDVISWTHPRMWLLHRCTSYRTVRRHHWQVIRISWALWVSVSLQCRAVVLLLDAATQLGMVIASTYFHQIPNTVESGWREQNGWARPNTHTCAGLFWRNVFRARDVCKLWLEKAPQALTWCNPNNLSD